MRNRMSKFIYLTHSLDSRFDDLSDMAQETECLFKHESVEIEKRFEKLPGSEKKILVEDYSVNSLLFQNDYPNLFRKAIVVTWYTYIETALEDIVVVLKHVSGSTENLSTDDKDERVKRLLKLIGSIVSYDFIGDTLWPIINNGRMVRDNIVHADARLRLLGKDEKLSQFLTSKPEYFILNGERFIIHPDYVQFLCNTGKAFLEKIFKKLTEFERKLALKNGEV